ncbi:MAG: 50S ribosomal protein L4 [Patescibacteria group bacterium]
METKLYNNKGEATGKLTVPENLFGLPWNADLVHQVVTAMRANMRPNVAHTKDRGEVRGGGKKPWQQKGTGRARHGSSRSPIWKGGGATHGPRKDKIYAQTVTQQMRQKALLLALSRKYRDGEIIFVDSIEMSVPKAKEAKAVLAAFHNEFKALGKSKNAALIALPVRHVPTQKSFNNFSNITVETVASLNPVSVLSAKYVMITSPKEAFLTLGKKRVVKAAKSEK